MLALKMLYSVNPPATIGAGKAETPVTADAEINFWRGLKVQGINLKIDQSNSPQTGLHQVIFVAEVKSGAKSPARTVYVSEGQLWAQQGEQWRIVAAKRGDVTRLEQPISTKKDLYPAGVDAKAEIKEALAHAAKDGKNVLLVFGANWCYDCHVLDTAFHRPDLAPLLEKNYEVVHVDVGEGDKNQDLMKQYEVPMSKGIPGLAVLDSNGKLLYSQRNGEFEHARALAPEDLARFLNRWKPEKR
ncbi:MAG TPA: thioredoxin family protein [Terriglobales bacterium]|nr:thioredoxin family protein [Terriglobales bacterium]